MRFTLSLFLAAGLLLTGCATPSQTTATAVSQTAVSDLKLIADASLPLEDAIATMAGASDALRAQIRQDIAQLEVAAAQVQPGVATAVAQPSVLTVSSALNDIIAKLQGFAVPANVTSILTAAQTLLPLVETAVGVAVAMAAQPGAMTPMQARAVLAAHR